MRLGVKEKGVSVSADDGCDGSYCCNVLISLEASDRMSALLEVTPVPTAVAVSTPLGINRRALVAVSTRRRPSGNVGR